MTKHLLIPILLLAFSLNVLAKDKYTPIFDGKTLKGWTQRNGTATYRVEKGAIVGNTKEGSPNLFLCTDKLYGDFDSANPKWAEIPGKTGAAYAWEESSTYIQLPPFFEGYTGQPGDILNITNARPLGIFGDSVTTDHISPAGAIKDCLLYTSDAADE